MKKIIAASFASALCFLSLASLQLPSLAQETQAPETQETQAPETQETPASETQETSTSTDILTAPAPDLTIQKINEAGNNAQVVIRNIGSANSQPCRLIVYRRNGANWSLSGVQAVPSIQPGTNEAVNISGVAASPTLYFVDALNTVSELNENNNFGFVP